VSTQDKRLTLVERKRINAQGVIQRDGFRLHIHQLATEIAASKLILNDERGVMIGTECSSLCLNSRINHLIQRVLPPARADFLTSEG
jgi:hydrogenase maturation factor HypF (carbamoyltransferase family)